MKKIIYMLLGFCCAWLITIIILFIFIVELPAQFTKTYQAVIVDKYNSLSAEESPKIILVGGSSGGISFDAKQMEEELNIPVVNMALHASFGMKLQTEMLKDNVNKGDIIILAYEYQNWENPSVFDAELVMTGFDGHLELYKYIDMEHYINLIKYFPKYAFTKLDSLIITPYLVNENWIYCRKAFDNKGNIDFKREKCEMPNPLPEGVYTITDFSKKNINIKSIEYVNQFVVWAEKKGAEVYISFPPFLDETAIGDANDIKNYQEYLESQLDATVISSIEDYIYPRKYIYDTPYHCTEEGTNLRTQSLIEDLKKYEE